MALADEVIRLRPLLGEETEGTQRRFGESWCELMYRSADVVLSNTTALYDFLQHDSCIYLASIEKNSGVTATYARPADTCPADWYPPDPPTLGVIYLASADLPSTLNVGVSLCAGERGRGYATRAVRLAVGWAFAELGCHRIQARVVRYGDAPTEDALRLFAGVGFVCEGTQRRALFCAPPTKGTGGVGDRATNGEWRDVSVFGVLDTDWALQASSPTSRTVKTLWDDMFARQQRESEDLVALEERAEQRRIERQRQRKLEAAQERIKASKKPRALPEPLPNAPLRPLPNTPLRPIQQLKLRRRHSQLPGVSAASVAPIASSSRSVSATQTISGFQMGPWAEVVPAQPYEVQSLETSESETECDSNASPAPSYYSPLLAAGTPSDTLSDTPSDTPSDIPSDMPSDTPTDEEEEDDTASTPSELSRASLDHDEFMSDGELVSYAGSPPRSPSVASSTSTLESWDVLDEPHAGTPPATP